MKSIKGKIYDKAGFITISNTENNNALCSEEFKKIKYFLLKFNADKNVDLIVIESGLDNCFSSGSNIEELKDCDEARAKVFAATGQDLIRTIRNIKKTVLCKINGICYGAGFEIALSSDIIFATENSLFGFPEVNQGIIPGLGGTILFTRKIYETFVKYLVFTGSSVSAKELFDKGIVNKVCKDVEELDDRVRDFSNLISKRSVFALGLAKETINAGLETDLDKALLIEQNAFTVAFSSNDKREGMTAFIEKRKPVFTDRWEDIEDL